MAKAPSTLDVVNFGCRLNALEGDQIRHAASQAGLENATIINSCAVTEEAVRQAKQAIRRAHRKEPDRPIYVTGCAAQTNAQDFATMPEVGRVIGNLEKTQSTAYESGASALLLGDIMSHRAPISAPAPAIQKRARAFVQIQNGCDHRCTFCIIPFGRGNSRSVKSQEVIRQCAALVEQGHQEIVLTGVDITSWGQDHDGGHLGVLIKEILDALPELPRLRLSSVDAVELDESFLDMVIHEPRLMPHLHLSLQAGDDMILKRMKRRHTRAQAIAWCADLKRKRPDITFGADIIAGFPTETEEMFANSLDLVAACDLVWLHVFPFSPRPGTPAARMPLLAREVITERAQRLRAAGDAHRQDWLDRQIGSEFRVLMESAEKGRAENFASVLTPTAQPPHMIVTMRITGHDGTNLIGEPHGAV